jgi:hypothetical protein
LEETKLRDSVKIIFGILLSVICVYIINKYFTNFQFDRLSGNGNPAIPIIGLLIVILLWTSYNVIKLVYLKGLGVFYSGIFILLATITFPWAIITGITRLRNIKDNLLLHFGELEVEQVTTGITFYTNGVYINYLTLLMYYCVVCSLAILMKKLRYRK